MSTQMPMRQFMAAAAGSTAEDASMVINASSVSFSLSRDVLDGPNGNGNYKDDGDIEGTQL